MRYSVALSGTTYITYADIQGILLAVSNGSVNAVSIIQSIRILNIGVTLMSTDNTAGTFNFEWLGSRIPTRNETLIFAQGAPAKWNFRPPPESLAGFWIESTDDSSTYDSIALCVMTVSSSDVTVFLDLHFEYIVVDGVGKPYTLTGAATFDGIAAKRIGTTSLSLAGSRFSPTGLSATNSSTIT
jgi:hypothetical protein